MPRLKDEQRETFCREYVHRFNTREAAFAAGYANPDIQGANLLCYPEVKARCRELNERQLRRRDISAERTLHELARVSFSDIRKIVDPDTGQLRPPNEWDDDTAASIASFTVETRKERDGSEVDLATGEMTPRFISVTTTKIRRYDKVPALGILAKHFKLVNDEGDGVNALASALSDRLNAAKRALPLPPPQPAQLLENPDGTFQDEHLQRLPGERREGEAVSQSGDGDRADAPGQ
jgi:phage terminase small subunit